VDQRVDSRDGWTSLRQGVRESIGSDYCWWGVCWELGVQHVCSLPAQGHKPGDIYVQACLDDIMGEQHPKHPVIS